MQPCAYRWPAERSDLLTALTVKLLGPGIEAGHGSTAHKASPAAVTQRRVQAGSMSTDGRQSQGLMEM